MTNKKIIFIILALVFFVFSPTLSTYFSQDDWVFLSHVYKQPFINIFHYRQEAFYRPIGQQLFFWIGTMLFGLDASGFHFLGLLIHLTNIVLLWKILQSFKSLERWRIVLTILYALNPIHTLALNWLTQTDLEIAVLFSLLTIHFWKRWHIAFLCFLAALLSHETAVMIPVWLVLEDLKRRSLRIQDPSFIKSVLFLTVAVLVLVLKYAANPFPFQSDYSLRIDPLIVISTVKWYILRVLFLPEGIRLLSFLVQALSFLSLLWIIFLFRSALIRPLILFSIGLAPVLLLPSHAFSVYAIIPLLFFILSLGQNIKQDVRHLFALISFSLFFVTSFFIVQIGVPGHWTTIRGKISQHLTSIYEVAEIQKKDQLKQRALMLNDDKEAYFATMQGRQFLILDRGNGRGVFDWLFHRGNDLTTQFLPDALFFKDSLISGKFPVWNPWIFAGMPYFLDPQNSLWYPPNYLLLFFPLELGFFTLLIGHLIFAGYFIKKLLATSSIWIQWTGVFLFIFSPKLIAHIEEGNWSLVIAASWLPALYWAMTYRCFWWIILALSAVTINNLNTGYYAVLFTTFFIILQKRSDLKRSDLLKLLQVLLLVTLITIPRWLPLAIYGNQTVRANLAEAPLPFWSWTKIAKSLLFPLDGTHPVLQDEEMLYVGIIPLIFLAWKGRTLNPQGSTLRNFWIAWIGFLVFVALNVKTPLFLMISYFPGFSLLRITTRPWIFISLFVALTVPVALARIFGKSKILGVLGVLGIVGEFGIFGYGIFTRRTIPKDPIPIRFYQQMIKDGTPVRAYCTTGCLDRLTAQEQGIALLGGNNPIQLTEFISYLEKAGGYQELAYHPILPPYTVFTSAPQPDAITLGKTATKFVISPYELTNKYFNKMDQEGEYLLYKNNASIMEFRDHYFGIQ